MGVVTPKPQCTKRSPAVWTEVDEAIRRANETLKSWNYPNLLSRSFTDSDFRSVCVCALQRIGVTATEEQSVKNVFTTFLHVLSYNGPRRDISGDSLLAAICWFCISLGAAESVMPLGWSPGCQELFASVPARKLSYARDSKLGEEDEIVLAAITEVLNRLNDDNLSEAVNPNWTFDSADIYKVMYLVYRIRLCTKDDTIRSRQESTVTRFLRLLLKMIVQNLEREAAGLTSTLERRNFLEQCIKEETLRTEALEEDVSSLQADIERQRAANEEKACELKEGEGKIAALIAEDAEKSLLLSKLQETDAAFNEQTINYQNLLAQCDEMNVRVTGDNVRRIQQLKQENNRLDSELKEVKEAARVIWEDEIVKVVNDAYFPQVLQEKNMSKGLLVCPEVRGRVTYNAAYFIKLLREFERFVDRLDQQRQQITGKNDGLRSKIENARQTMMLEEREHEAKLEAASSEIAALKKLYAGLRKDFEQEQAELKAHRAEQFPEEQLCKAEYILEQERAKHEATKQRHREEFGALCNKMAASGELVREALNAWAKDKAAIDRELGDRWQTVSSCVRDYLPQRRSQSHSEDEESRLASPLEEMSSSSGADSESAESAQDKENAGIAPQDLRPGTGFKAFINKVLFKRTDQSQSAS